MKELPIRWIVDKDAIDAALGYASQLDSEPISIFDTYGGDSSATYACRVHKWIEQDAVHEVARITSDKPFDNLVANTVRSRTDSGKGVAKTLRSLNLITNEFKVGNDPDTFYPVPPEVQIFPVFNAQYNGHWQEFLGILRAGHERTNRPAVANIGKRLLRRLGLAK